MITLNIIKNLAEEVGLSIFGIVPATPDVDAARHLESWQGQGFAGEMAYMKRAAERLSDPKFLLPEAKTILQFAVHYGSYRSPDRPAGFGRVARYAWGEDYHEVLRDRLKQLIARLKDFHPELRVRGFSDAVPLMERPIGQRARLGFVGKNTLLIRPGQGSFFFLAELVTDIEIEGFDLPPVKGGCGGCQRCLDKCPTKAFVAPYRLDARRCISYLTIEKRGALNSEEESMLGEWAFGCDVCQEVCPFNHSPIKFGRSADLPQFSAMRGAGPLLNFKDIFELRDDTQFEARFKGSPLSRPGREGLLRNCAAVAGNTLWIEGGDALLRLVEEDSSVVVRESAVRALKKITKVEGGDFLVRVSNRLNALRGSAINSSVTDFFEG